MKDKETQQLIFVTITLVVMASSALYLFLTAKGLDLNKIGFNYKSQTVVADLSTFGKISITSSAFGTDGKIPAKYSCNGSDVNPPLSFSGVASGAKSLALVIEDPDAPYKTWTHWVVFNINPRATTIYENSVPWGAVLGQNDFGVGEYRGPCPPLGLHHYHFKVYALDIVLKLDAGANRQQLNNAIKGHILGGGDLVGVFEK